MISSLKANRSQLRHRKPFERRKHSNTLSNERISRKHPAPEELEAVKGRIRAMKARDRKRRLVILTLSILLAAGLLTGFVFLGDHMLKVLFLRD